MAPRRDFIAISGRCFHDHDRREDEGDVLLGGLVVCVRLSKSDVRPRNNGESKDCRKLPTPPHQSHIDVSNSRSAAPEIKRRQYVQIKAARTAQRSALACKLPNIYL